jgi:hypothetical protein
MANVGSDAYYHFNPWLRKGPGPKGLDSDLTIPKSPQEPQERLFRRPTGERKVRRVRG